MKTGKLVSWGTILDEEEDENKWNIMPIRNVGLEYGLNYGNPRPWES